MGEAMVFKGTKRESTGKGVARKLRREGCIPGVVYGPDKPSLPISLYAKGVAEKLKGSWSEAKLYDLDLEGEKISVIIRDVQTEPVSREVLHVDLYAVTFGKLLTLMVPLKFQGEPIGVKHGGIVEFLMDELEIECLPRNIPEELAVDISYLEVGDSLFVRDIPLPEAVEVKGDLDQPVVTIGEAKVKEETVIEEEEEMEEETEESES
jgi:large subunit ribosomal protein L25